MRTGEAPRILPSTASFVRRQSRSRSPLHEEREGEAPDGAVIAAAEMEWTAVRLTGSTRTIGRIWRGNASLRLPEGQRLEARLQLRGRKSAALRKERMYT
jgi:hypothetical protein